MTGVIIWKYMYNIICIIFKKQQGRGIKNGFIFCLRDIRCI